MVVSRVVQRLSSLPLASVETVKVCISDSVSEYCLSLLLYLVNCMIVAILSHYAHYNS